MLVDDDTSFTNIYSKILERKRYHVMIAHNGEEALELLNKTSLDIVVSDVVMPTMGGIQLLEEVKAKYPHTEVIMLSGKGTIKDAVNAMKLGAYNYLLKPVDIDELLINVERALQLKTIHDENIIHRDAIKAVNKDEILIGKSPIIDDIREKVGVVSPQNSTVLIYGETGTGKEVIAREIHYSSNRKNKPFIKINCASYAETLLESELFGHEKGAFTGADRLRRGCFELAHGGTLLLDEIGDLPLNFQVKLLRVLQEKEFQRVGGTQTIKVDFRLLTSTNRDLLTLIDKGLFREDLYYRLNVVPIYIPPLRERKEDIPLLAFHFLGKFSREMSKKISDFSPDAYTKLMNYDWPGNVRELKNIVERCVVFAKESIIKAKEIPLESNENNYSSNNIKEAVEQYERDFIIKALEENSWNITKTAEKIGIARKNLHMKINKYDIKT
ncbi:MAG TPA: sigma-54-dependent Fis family transcriptional regulator [Thermoanaerobacterales bacterium]|nr:sigma-54-dependent Fis family transcriptional regulator [Thermoanaerobacterales bacterium]